MVNKFIRKWKNNKVGKNELERSQKKFCVYETRLKCNTLKRTLTRFCVRERETTHTIRRGRRDVGRRTQLAKNGFLKSFTLFLRIQTSKRFQDVVSLPTT